MRRSTSPRSSDTKSSMSDVVRDMPHLPPVGRDSRNTRRCQSRVPGATSFQRRSSLPPCSGGIRELARQGSERAPQQVEQPADVRVARIDVMCHEGAVGYAENQLRKLARHPLGPLLVGAAEQCREEPLDRLQRPFADAPNNGERRRIDLAALERDEQQQAQKLRLLLE